MNTKDILETMSLMAKNNNSYIKYLEGLIAKLTKELIETREQLNKAG